MNCIFLHELKENFKSLLIWSFVTGGIGLFCVLLFPGMKDTMGDMAESFASMGAFSDAFGMSTLSIASLSGFFATEVGTIQTLGGAMFAATVGTVMLSKEEDGHTSEFLFTLPVSRQKITIAKYISVVFVVMIFTVICIAFYELGFLMIGESVDCKNFLIFMLMQFVMAVEIASICFGISAFNRNNRLGVGLGVALLLYIFDLIARVVPSISKAGKISPCYYSNASQLFTENGVESGALIFGIVVLVLGFVCGFVEYSRRDLAS